MNLNSLAHRLRNMTEQTLRMALDMVERLPGGERVTDSQPADRLSEAAEDAAYRVGETATRAGSKLREVTAEMRPGHHVVPYEDGWAIRHDNAEDPVHIFGSRDSAIQQCEQLARRQKDVLYIHDTNGELEERREYFEH